MGPVRLYVGYCRNKSKWPKYLLISYDKERLSSHQKQDGDEESRGVVFRIFVQGAKRKGNADKGLTMPLE